ncbi:hypothetical protein BJY04DRAFT_201402 [Aspergillus karnatakaensis]|uniref:uncharacterized protein n=1 Tax=Aspergillus karnatakaensis TaxID=1810916 RepID=UPI003CCD4FA1
MCQAQRSILIPLCLTRAIAGLGKECQFLLVHYQDYLPDYHDGVLISILIETVRLDLTQVCHVVFDHPVRIEPHDCDQDLFTSVDSSINHVSKDLWDWHGPL